MANNINIKERVDMISKNLTYSEQHLGRELIQPFPTASSGSRKILFSSQSEQVMALCKPEVPLIQTGFENEFGRRSTSFRQAEERFVVLDRIEKYSMYPGHHYYLIVYLYDSRKLDCIEVYNYRYITESFGYQMNNSFLDNLTPGSVVEKGDVISKSYGFDDYNNRMDGINVLTMYIAQNKTTEDAIEISESCAKKFTSPLVKKTSFMINENDILLNLYGNETIYKVIPDIGQPISNGILAAVRRENQDEALFSQVYSRLSDINMGDEKITSSGVVVDIDIRTNNPDLMQSSIYNTQLNMYYQDKDRFCREVLEKTNKYMEECGCRCAYNLQKLFTVSKQILGGVKYNMDSSIYSNLQMDIYTLEDNELHIGDKLTNRYGGKGVISSIVPDHLMPQTKDGRHIEMKYNQATVVNRLNPSQLYEVELNAASNAVVKSLNKNDIDGSFNKIFEFVSLFSKTQAEELKEYVKSCKPTERRQFLESIINDEQIVMSILPIAESISIDVILKMIEMFPETLHDYILTPHKDSNGNYRLAKTFVPVMVGKQYIYRLKQYAEEKFSATSMSFSNNKGENSRNKNSDKTPFTNTPINQGEMEIGGFTHLGAEINVLNLMLYSRAPVGRRAVKDLLTKNPADINITLDSDAKSRSAETVNTFMKAIGLQLTFLKVPKRIKSAFSILPKIEPAFYLNEDYTERVKKLIAESDISIEVSKHKDGKNYPKYKGMNIPTVGVVFRNVVTFGVKDEED